MEMNGVMRDLKHVEEIAGACHDTLYFTTEFNEP